MLKFRSNDLKSFLRLNMVTLKYILSDFAQFLYSHPMPPTNLMSEYVTIFWDSVHNQPWVYEELNNSLLNVFFNNA
jgi:hypothetical protein